MTRTLSNAPDQGRYELRENGELIATADYAISGDKVSITRIFTRPTHRGQGIAADITEYAVDQIVADGRKIVPVCWYAAGWFEGPPERADALA